MKSKELSVILQDRIVKRRRSGEVYKTISRVESSQEHSELHHKGNGKNMELPRLLRQLTVLPK